MPDPTSALYVRLPQREADKLDRAAEALGTNKKTLVTTLVSRYLDPDTPGALEPLRALGSAQRRVTVGAPETGMTVGHHAFTPAEALAAFPPLEALDCPTAAQAAALLQVFAVYIVALAEDGALGGLFVGDEGGIA